ncbi:hypothetical protein ACN6KF_005683 [Labrys sp. La1]|uniref:hypothetical protein n=1 Tax=Labrys sp. La1 TaxID=3404917 RepID=UPI003EBBF469
MASLRLAHRTLGTKRGQLGLGILISGGGAVTATLGAFALLGAVASAANAAPLSLGGGTVGGNGEQIAIGTFSQAVAGGTGGSPIAIGVAANASGTAPPGFTFEAVAIGNSAIATGPWATSVGTNASATGTGGSAFGTFANASGNQATAIGNGATATNTQATAMGYLANASAVDATALGSGATATATGSTALGAQAKASFNYSTALGAAANANGMYATALGINSTATGDGSIAGGYYSVSNGLNAMTLGAFAKATGINTVAIGPAANATGQSATAFGVNSVANGVGAVAVGPGANATGTNAAAFGPNSLANGVNTTALGNGANASAQAGDVALGAGSTTSTVVNTTGTTINGTTYTFAGTDAKSTVSVGSLGNERTVTNVAAGQISASSTDAINGSQLYATNQAVSSIGNNVNNLGNSVASGLGGGSSYDPSTGTVITSLNYGGDTFNSVQGVIDKIGGAISGGGIKYFHANSTDPDSIASGQNAVGIGPNSVASGDNSFAAGNGAQASGASSVATGNGATATGSNSIATGTGAKASGSGSIASGNGAQAGGSNSVAVGTNANAAQDNAVALGNGADTSGGQAGDVALGSGSKTSTVVNTTGTTINGTNYTFAGTNATSTVSVGSAGNERTVTNVAAGQISGSSTDAINGSQLYATNQAVAAANQQVTQLGNNVNNLGTSTASTIGGNANYDPNTGKVTMPSYTLNGSNATYNDVMSGVQAIANGGAGPVQYSNPASPSTPNGGTPTNSLTLVGTGGPVTISNLGPGQVSATSTQAINGSQLYGTAQSVASALGGGSTVNSAGQVTAPSYSVGGNSYNNVGGAVTALDQRINNIGGNVANLQSQVSDNLKEARKGIASALAASALRYDDRPGKVSVATGMSVYHRQVGLAAGLGWTSEDAKWRANVAATFSPGSGKSDFGVMGGLAYTFN